MGEIKVQLFEYNPNWEQQYADERKWKGYLYWAYWKYIDKGVKAKPIIDILVGVQSLDEVPNFIDALSKINYEYIQKLEFKDRKFFRKGLWGQEKIYLYICEYNSDEWIEKLLFRDFKKLRCKIT